jgi:hypothetical protein
MYFRTVAKKGGAARKYILSRLLDPEAALVLQARLSQVPDAEYLGGRLLGGPWLFDCFFPPRMAGFFFDCVTLEQEMERRYAKRG